VRYVKHTAGERSRIARLRPVTAALAALTAMALLGACGSNNTPSTNQSSKPAAAATTPSVLDSINGADLSHPVEETPEQINAYWTQDRLREAESNEPSGGGEGISAQDLGLDVQIKPDAAPENLTSTVANSSAGYFWTKVGATGKTVGRIFYTFGKQNFSCSGAVVTSRSKTLVATAGHCVWNTLSMGWAANVLFIPAYNNGQAPYGRWAGARVYAPAEFWRYARQDPKTKHSAGSGWAYDHAFIRMKPLNGQLIQNRLGSLGISFSGLHTNVLVLGYPAAAPFDGKFMRYCGITNMVRDSRTYTDWSLPCRMTPGASGGPWIASYRAGQGYVTATTSVGNGSRLWGAFMGKVAYALYQRADANKP
jgi:V8-like Glu-specific endopeptidase